jgi:PleD family two-component response regulator
LYASDGFGTVSWCGAGRNRVETVASYAHCTVRLLVIEDDEEMAEAIAAGLRQSQMTVDVALDGATGLARALVNDYDVIVLDRVRSESQHQDRRECRR